MIDIDKINFPMSPVRRRHKDLIVAVQVLNDFSLGEIKGEAGDYIIQTKLGRFVMRPDTFVKNFEYVLDQVPTLRFKEEGGSVFYEVVQAEDPYMQTR